MTELPRQTYRTESDAAAENEVAERFATWANAQQFKIGTDPKTKMKSRVDRALCRGGIIVAFCEIKTCGKYFQHEDSYITGERKLLALRQFKTFVRVPVMYVVKFRCNTLAYFDVDEQYVWIEKWGRFDRGDPGDAEPGASFSWDVVKMVPYKKEAA